MRTLRTSGKSGFSSLLFDCSPRYLFAMFTPAAKNGCARQWTPTIFDTRTKKRGVKEGRTEGGQATRAAKQLVPERILLLAVLADEKIDGASTLDDTWHHTRILHTDLQGAWHPAHTSREPPAPRAEASPHQHRERGSASAVRGDPQAVAALGTADIGTAGAVHRRRRWRQHVEVVFAVRRCDLRSSRHPGLRHPAAPLSVHLFLAVQNTQARDVPRSCRLNESGKGKKEKGVKECTGLFSLFPLKRGDVRVGIRNPFCGHFNQENLRNH